MISNAAASHFTDRTADWPLERIAKLEREEIEQLRANALTLGGSRIVELCDTALASCTKRSRTGPAANKKPRRLISRSAAFEARGVYLDNARTSWSGVRRSDGIVVIALWADAVRSRDGGCGYLLWAPNSDGKHPWSETPAGRECRAHCELALTAGNAEGLLVYGDRLDGYAPQHKAKSVHGIDPQTVVRMRVEKRGDEYWAVWGKRSNGNSAGSAAAQ
jgi:hypothetical protein